MVMLVLWLVLPALPGRGVPTHSLTYSQFLSDVSAGQIKTVTIDSGGNVSGTLTSGHDYTTVIPVQLAGSGLLDRLQAAKVQITAPAPGPSFGSKVLSWSILLVPLLLLGWLWVRLSRGARQMQQGVMGVGRSRAKVVDAERPATAFADVAG
jgi:cell division protease FtsH